MSVESGDTIIPLFLNPSKRFISYRFKTRKLGVASKLHRLFIDKLKLKVVYEGRVIVNSERIGYGVIDITNFSGTTKDIINAIYEEKILTQDDELTVYEPSADGIGVAPFKYPLKIGSYFDAIVFPEKMINETIEGIKKKFGSAGESFLYYMGKSGGINYAEYYKKAIPMDKKRLLEFLLRVLTVTGICSEAKILEYDERKLSARISFLELFECRNLRKEKPNSHFFRGFIAGVISSLWETEVEAEEINCVAKGDISCQFIITKEG